MDMPITDLHFKLMALSYKFRDLFSPRKNILIEAGIKSGFHVLDYGCGPGSYIMPLAELVGTTGKIYALDIHPLAIQMVRGLARKHNFTNVETILSDCDTGLSDTTIDAVLLYDTLHNLHALFPIPIGIALCYGFQDIQRREEDIDDLRVKMRSR
jgi:ubiquinone/menaquinone biosynthesis C-methylase UbiE